jgi:hypothetical protein
MKDARDAVIPKWASAWADIIWLVLAVLMAAVVIRSCT